MSWLRQFLFRFSALFRRRKLEEDMAKEIRLHLEEREERNRAGGLNDAEARHTAMRGFGGVEQVKENARDQWRMMWIDQVASDIRFSFRSLVRVPLFSLTVVAILALGIGVGTITYTLSAGALFYPSPYPRSGQLFAIGLKDKQGPFQPGLSPLHLTTYREQAGVFSGYAAVAGRMANVVIDDVPITARHVAMSEDGFRTLGIRPALGRSFSPDESRQHADNVVVISEYLWRRYFNADPAAIGRSILIDQRPCTVIGVLKFGQPTPFEFQGDVYVPLVPSQRVDELWLHVVGRLRDGITPDAAARLLASITLPVLPPWAVDLLANKTPALQAIEKRGGTPVDWVLFLGGGFLFGMAGLNASNFVLLRLLDRNRELSVRLAMGGSRWQVARLLMVECALLWAAATVAVLLLARLEFPMLFADITHDRTLEFFQFWSDRDVVTGIIVYSLLGLGGLFAVPLLRFWRLDVGSGLKAGGSSGDSRTMARARNSLVASQAALAVVLLVGTGLLVQTFRRLHQVDLGFDFTDKGKIQLSFPEGYMPKRDEWLGYFERLKQRLIAIPGVNAVASGQDSLLVGYPATERLLLRDGSAMPVAESFVATDFARVAGMRLLSGRWFSNRVGDWEVVINETLARARFGSTDPLGESIELQEAGLGLSIKTPESGRRLYHVVGVARDVRESVKTAAVGPRVYLPDWMFPPFTQAFVVHFEPGTPREIDALIRKAVYDFDPRVIVFYMARIEEIVDNSMGRAGFIYCILRGLSGIALLLAVVGIFAVVAYSVKACTREIGVRMALGAQAWDLCRAVVQRGLRIVGFGILAGLIVAAGLTRFMQGLLFETTVYDPVVYITVIAALGFAAIVACLLPARRAVRVDPMIALRCE